MAGIGESKARKPAGDAELGDEHPGAAAPEKPRQTRQIEESITGAQRNLSV